MSNSSDIPRARRMISQVLHDMPNNALKKTLAKALSLMFRAKYIRKARPVHQDITDKMRRKIHKLNPNRNLTQVDIARRVGLRRPASVSEILNEKR